MSVTALKAVEISLFVKVEKFFLALMIPFLISAIGKTSLTKFKYSLVFLFC